VGALQQDDHTVHHEDPDGQQADRSHLEGEERGTVSPKQITPCSGPQCSLGVGVPLRIKPALGQETLSECPHAPRCCV
jgi:hypothetical protein